MREHTYNLLTLTWTGNKGTGTADYRAYGRSHTISSAGKPDIFSSSDPAFRGDTSMYNPEELLVAALSGCHMLWFLHFCSANGVVATAYEDKPVGTMLTEANGNGRFTQITLHPVVTVTDESMLAKLDELHRKAHEFCFIANSVNFEVKIEGRGKVG